MKSLRCLFLGSVLVSSALTLSMVGCAGVGTQPWAQNVQQDSVKLATQAEKAASSAMQSTTTAIQRLQQRYNANRDVLKTYTDSDENAAGGKHGEAQQIEDQIRKELHRARLAMGSSNKPAAANGPSAAAAAAPGSARTPHGPPPEQSAPPPHQPQLENAGYRWPLDAYIVSSEYGQRWGKMHKGIDLAAESGDPVYAVADGEVIYAGDGLRGYGNVVIIQHDGRMSSLYAHNSELKVKKGDTVSRGTLIALLGSTGHSTGPHVHFEIRDGDMAVNPATLLPQSSVAAAPAAAPGHALAVAKR